MINRRSKYPRVVEQCVLFLSEHHEVVVEVVRDLVERVEVVLEEVPVASKVLCQVPGDISIKLGVTIAPDIVDVVLVSVEVSTASLEVVAAVRIDGIDVDTSETPMMVTEVIVEHAHEVVIQALESTWN